MNVIKRDGRIVDYNRAKIIIAIQKANEEVKPKEKITSKQIEEIADVVEASKKKNLQVEEIQDIIESELVKMLFLKHTFYIDIKEQWFVNLILQMIQYYL